MTSKDRLIDTIKKMNGNYMPFYKQVQGKMAKELFPISENIFYINNKELLGSLPGLSSTEVLSELLTISLLFNSINNIILNANINNNEYLFDISLHLEGKKDLLLQMIRSFKKAKFIQDVE